MLRRITALAIRANNCFAETIARVSAWRFWMTLVSLGTASWLVLDQVTRDRFDPGKSLLVLILTIQTSIDSQGQRLNQAEQRHGDLQREEQRKEQLDAITQLTLAIKEELDRSRDRDDAAAARDEALRALVVKLVDLFDEGR